MQRNRWNSLATQFRDEKDQRAEADKEIERALREHNQALEKRIRSLSDQLSQLDRDISDRVTKEAQMLREEIKQKNADLAQTIETMFSELSSVKTDRYVAREPVRRSRQVHQPGHRAQERGEGRGRSASRFQQDRYLGVRRAQPTTSLSWRLGRRSVPLHHSAHVAGTGTWGAPGLGFRLCRHRVILDPHVATEHHDLRLLQCQRRPPGGVTVALTSGRAKRCTLVTITFSKPHEQTAAVIAVVNKFGIGCFASKQFLVLH